MDALARRRQVAEQTEAFGDLSAYDPDKRKRYAAYSWPEVTYLMFVGLGFNIFHGIGPQTYWQLFSALNLTVINQVLAGFDAPNATFRPGQYMLIELAHTVLGVAVEHLLAFLKQDQAWARGVFGFDMDAKPVRGRRGRVVQVQFRPHVPTNSAVSMFKAKVPAQVYAEALELLRYQLLELVSVDLLDDAFIVDRATDGIFGRLHVPGGLHVEVGFDLFLQFVIWHGVVAQIEYARGYRVWIVDAEGRVVAQEHRYAPRAPNAVPLQKLILLYFQRLRLDADNAFQLASKLENEGDAQTGAPSVQVIHRFLGEVDPDVIQKASAALIRRFRRRAGSHSTLIGIDSTLLEVSKRYQGAEWLYDPKRRCRVWAYKLYVLLDLERGTLIGFVLGNDPRLASGLSDEEGHLRSFKDSKDGLLFRVRTYIRQVIGPCQGVIFLFDKGFFNGKAFYELDKQEDHFVTPAKKVVPVAFIEQVLHQDRFRPLEGGKRKGEQIAHTSVSLKGYQGAIRMIVTRFWGKILLTDAKGNTLRDADGNRCFDWGWIYHSYLTDVPTALLSAEQVVQTYRKRWRVENCIQRLRADWALRCFPSTRLQVVQVHLQLVLMSYLLCIEFRRLFGKPYTAMGLSQLRNTLFNVPIGRLSARLPLLFAGGDYQPIGPTTSSRITRRAIDQCRLANTLNNSASG